MVHACPVCGCSISTEEKLVAHVEQHFADEDRAPQAPLNVECNACGESLLASELDAHVCPLAHVCPVCGVRCPTAGQLVVHMDDKHFDVYEAGGINRPNGAAGASGAAAPAARPSGAGAGQRVAVKTEGGHAPAGLAQAPAGQECILCPLGCGQWVPLTELDDHETMHRLMSEEQGAAAQAPAPAQAGPSGAGPSTSTQAGNQDLRAMLSAGLAGMAGTSAGGGGGGPAGGLEGDEALAAALQAAWCEEDDLHEGFNRDGSGPGSGTHGQGDDATLAARLQEEEDFRRLQAQYGFTTERPGRCHTCGQEGHWSRDCPSNANAPRNQPRLPSDDTTQLCQSQRSDPQSLTLAPDISTLVANAYRNMPEGPLRPHVWICGPVLHFAGQAADRGWGCGWRNMQMQISHLLLRSGGRPFRDRLFGGAGFVPDIVSLQAWLEAAWSAGFDLAGAQSLGRSVQGESKWVGTTEAATLLAHQNVPTRIIDFKTGSGYPLLSEDPQGRTIHTDIVCDTCGIVPIVGIRHHSLARPDYDLCSACVALPGVRDRDGPFEQMGQAGRASAQPQPQPAGVKAEAPAVKAEPGTGEPAEAQGGENWWVAASAAQGGRGRGGRGGRGGGRGAHAAPPLTPMQRAMLDWVWKYFTRQHLPTSHLHATNPPGTPAHTRVVQTGLPPLYFQHAGHSRTIIGIECWPIKGQSGLDIDNPGPCDPDKWVYSLLILDPSTRPQDVINTLQSGTGWQRFIKRGLHTLKHNEYQLLYSLDTPLSREARQIAKVVRAAEVVNVSLQ